MGKIRLLLSRFKHEDLMSGFFGGKTNFAKNFLKNEGKFEMRGYKVLFDILKQFPNSARIERIYYIFGVRKKRISEMGSKPIVFYISSLVR
ncbi:MAG: hypothetical protein WC650_03705 [Candidatus Doudnabacteria bacterium]